MHGKIVVECAGADVNWLSPRDQIEASAVRQRELAEIMSTESLGLHHLERSVDAAAAIALAEKEITALGLHPRIEVLGKTVLTHRCTLQDEDSNEVAVGIGKGQGRQSLASAMFEALEHYALDARRFAVHAEFRDVADIATHDLLGSQKVFELLLQIDPAARVPCLIHSAIDGRVTLPYPFFLSFPYYADDPFPGDTFDYSSLAKYSSNNGTAIGVTFEEALVHATCELIERDAIATFLLQALVFAPHATMRLLDKGSLPASSQRLVEMVESEVGDELSIFDITNDLSVPAFMAIVRKEGLVIPLVGAGASLSRPYALERAVLEALQLSHIHDPIMEAGNKRMKVALAPFPKHLRCLLLDFGDDLRLGRHERVRFEDDGELVRFGVTDQDLQNYVDRLCQALNRTGHRLYARTLWIGSSGIACVHCVVPGLEYFHLVLSGMPVLPSLRGRQLRGATS